MGKKYYAVKQGRTPGLYYTWDECKAQVDGYSGAVYKSFPTKERALSFLEGENEYCVEDSVDTAESFVADSITDGVIAYVDGSYHNGTGEFSYGVVILRDGQEICYREKYNDAELASMRNVAGEIKGAECAMRYAVDEGLDKITIVHDYEGIARWCLGEWKTNKEGTKSYKAYYDSIKNRVKITFQKVKGHSGDHYNDMADKLAKEALGIS